MFKVCSLDDLIQKIIVPINHRETVEDLIEQNIELFTEKDTDIERTNTIKMTTDAGNHPSIELRPYETPFAKHPIKDKEVSDRLAANIIHPSRLSWSIFIMVIDKKNDTKRFCTDFRKLNNISKKSSWPLPVIDDMLAALGKAEYFTNF